MISRKDEAVKKRAEGYTCAQAVACTYCDLVGVDKETAFKATEALGVGMGNMQGTCGAITAACVIAGFAKSNGDMEKKNTKGESLKTARDIMLKFEERNSSVICKDLKGMETGKVLRTCPECVCDAAEILEEVLFSE